MDLVAQAQQLRLDLLAVEASRVLSRADVPHALLKGPTTALWLYDEPRAYRDVDLLVPTSRAVRAAAVLADAGVAHPAAGRWGEEAEHSRLLVSPHGDELDLHVALPGTAPDGDRLWTALAPHVVPFPVPDTGVVPALDTPARVLVLALHALAAGPHETTPADDLRRARAQAPASDWA
ncbi:nucleotidyltransferase family protein, partial [Jatrophihabitans sp. YIM 134969]